MYGELIVSENETYSATGWIIVLPNIVLKAIFFFYEAV